MFLYSAVSSPFSTQNALHFTLWEARSFQHQLYFTGKHSDMLQLLHRYYSLIFSHHYKYPGTHILLFIYHVFKPLFPKNKIQYNVQI